MEADWPDASRATRYFRARPTDQFDDVLHFDQTRAVEPVEHGPHREVPELAETYPSGL